ncbi:MAG: aminodeoxychorismate/anthranilate synthase component II [Vulcanibacillus sp.]
MLLIIDNYDSFTYNLVQYFGELTNDIEIYRNDQITLIDIDIKRPDYILVSPGPCTPNQAGISIEVIKRFAGLIPILGVCLGHQAIAQAFGGEIIQSELLKHGKTSYIYHDNKTIFQGVPNPFIAGRYHSLIVNKENFPSCLEVTAWTDKGEIMGLRHKEFPLEGVQFHPESILTNQGKRILENFLTSVRIKNL